MGKLSAVLHIIRIRQWTKNLIVLTPAFFAQVVAIDNIAALVTGFLFFSISAGLVYVLNDIRDLALDALHPVKKLRPLPSGRLSKRDAGWIALTLVGMLICLGFFVPNEFIAMALLYLLVNLGYSFGLKKVPYLEVFLVSLGFVIRVYAGGFLVDVPISKWLLSLTIAASLVIVLSKRLSEVQSSDVVTVRSVVKFYNPTFLKVSIGLIALVAAGIYFLYTLDPIIEKRVGSSYFWLTTFFILAGLARFGWQLEVKKNTGAPAELFYKDKVILLIILAWIAVFWYFLYG